jgi:hypothetical protein
MTGEVAAPTNRFEAGRFQIGDTLLGLRVVAAEVRPSLAGEGEWTADVRFAGSIELSGELRPHHDDPEPDAICFFADSASALRLPRLPKDERIAWFCFENPDSVPGLEGNPPRPRRARLVVDGFRYVYAHTDVFNTARLVRMIE